MSTKKASNSPGLCTVKGKKMTLMHIDRISNLMTVILVKIVVSILVILKVKWDQPIQQLGKSNTSRSSVLVYKFSILCKCNLCSDRHSSTESSDIFHCYNWIRIRGVSTCTITLHVKCRVVDLFPDIFIVIPLFGWRTYFIFLDWNSILTARISGYIFRFCDWVDCFYLFRFQDALILGSILWSGQAIAVVWVVNGMARSLCALDSTKRMITHVRIIQVCISLVLQHERG
jgi:hypothetical protein